MEVRSGGGPAIVSESYTNHFGIDFLNLPSGDKFPRVNAALQIWKKHRLFAESGLKPDCDPADCFMYAVTTLFPSFKITPWTEIMVHDLTHFNETIFLGPASCGKSHIMAAYALLLYATDPSNTAVIMCSTSKEDLKARAWSPLKEFVSSLRNHKDFSGTAIRAMATEYCVCCEEMADVPESSTKRASIRGVSLDDGKLQGCHVPGAYPTVALMIDELSTIENVPALMTGILNISTGAEFRFCAAANPDGWQTTVSSTFYTPIDGAQSVTPDTGCWVSRSGYHVRHFDGMKSPAILDPSKEREWPFLLNTATLKRHLERCNGDTNSADFFKMIRGFPTHGAAGDAVVLDPIVAAREQVSRPLHTPVWGSRNLLGKVAGVDPAWSSAGDAAIMASPNVFSQEGKVYIDYTNVVRTLPIVSSDTKPVLTQLRDGVIARMKTDNGPSIDRMAIDSSGNQALADDLTTFVGPGCLPVNSSKIASDTFLRAGETQESLKARARIADRGTESWFVLAEFCKAGMVRGLPISVVNDLCNRRYLRKADGSELSKLRIEPKEIFCKRVGHGSPNEADACALAALAVKERMGVMPFGSVPAPDPSGIAPNAYSQDQNYQAYIPFDKGDGGSNDFDDIGTFGD